MFHSRQHSARTHARTPSFVLQLNLKCGWQYSPVNEQRQRQNVLLENLDHLLESIWYIYQKGEDGLQLIDYE